MKLVFTLLMALALLCSTAATADADTGAAVLTFSGFDGSGQYISVSVADPDLVSYTSERQYDAPEDEPMPPGSGYRTVYTFTGLKPGKTSVTISVASPLTDTDTLEYELTIGDDLTVHIVQPHALIRFEFTHTSPGRRRSYTVYRLNGEYRFQTARGAAGTLDAAGLEALLALISDCEAAGWGSFNELTETAVDGQAEAAESFSLSASFADGAELYACGTAALPDDLQFVSDALAALLEPERTADDSALAGTYKDQSEGFGGDFTIQLNADGTYTFYEGMLSSYIGGGNWSRDGGLLFLDETNGFEIHNIFMLEADALIFVEANSDNFIYVKVLDGERFTKLAPAGGAGD